MGGGENRAANTGRALKVSRANSKATAVTAMQVVLVRECEKGFRVSDKRGLGFLGRGLDDDDCDDLDALIEGNLKGNDDLVADDDGRVL